MPAIRQLSRRRMLQQSGGALAAAALGAAAPFGPRASAQQLPTPAGTAADAPVSAVTARLAGYMAEARGMALPGEVIERAKRHILDTIAAMVSGSQLEPGQKALAFARSYGGSSTSTIVADTATLGPIEAAMVNGTMGHADETDDTLAPGPWHPGCVVVPAALAVGEQFDISGEHFLRAVVLGYDVGTRVLAAIQPAFTGQRLSYGMGGVFGAAAAAASAASLDARQMRFVLSYAAQQSSGIESFPRDPDHIEKGFIFGGMPARGGVTAALVVHSGWTAVDDVMAGDVNFIAANAPTGDVDRLTQELGELYYVMRANIKRWTVGYPIQAPLDALDALLARERIDPARVQEVILRYQPNSITDNSGATDINVQHAVAVMLVDGTVTFRSIHERARMRDPEVLRIKQRVRLEPGPGGGAPRPPLVQIVLTDGTRLTQDNVGSGVIGSAANPMSLEQIVGKSRDLMEPVLGRRQTERLIDRVMAIESVGNVGELRPLLQTRAGAAPRISEYSGAL